MAKDIDLNELELLVKRKLEKYSDMVVEAPNLSERAYNTFPNMFDKKHYEVRGKEGILHISRRYENA